MKTFLPWALVFVLGACSGAVDPSKIEVIPDDIELLPLEATCEVLLDTETLLGVSPQGQAWLRGDVASRYVDQKGLSTQVSIPSSAGQFVVAFRDERALFEAPQGIYAVDKNDARSIVFPESVAAFAAMCGDPETDGPSFVATENGLFRYENDGWAAFRSEFIDFRQIKSFATIEGQCIADDEMLWFRSRNHAWRFDLVNDQQEQVQNWPEVHHLDIDPELGAVIISNSALYVGAEDSLRKVKWGSGTLQAFSKSEGVLWVAHGGQLLSRDGVGTWKRYLPETIKLSSLSALYAYSKDAFWAQTSDQLCHVYTDDLIIVKGIAPYERYRGNQVSLEVSTVVSTDKVAVSVDEGPFQTFDKDASGEFFSGTVELGDLEGWHSLRFRAQNSGKQWFRTLRVERLAQAL
ncbi:MAG: hypothetical protein IPJ88_17615 [Myxococcales bacterium]|nr:MAG: hypothetical protein IPJ88_17615 [Myxococcales bacterium]